MKTSDLKLLVTIEDRVIAEDIQSILEEHGIYTILESDNPASSIVSIYSGINPIESMDIKINVLDFQRAIEILNESPYKELIN
jgi:hypothetical protein